MASPTPAATGTYALSLGSLLVLYTDGLIEVNRDPVAGEGRLIAAIRAEVATPSANSAQAILDRVLTGSATRDDVAVLALAIAPTPLAALDLSLPAVPATLPLIRQSFRRLSRAIRLDPDRSSALEIAVGEAVNNVIEHAYGVTPGLVHIRARPRDSRLVVEIADTGEWRTARADGGGRGLRILQALVDEASVDATPAGTTVTLTAGLRAGTMEGAR